MTLSGTSSTCELLLSFSLSFALNFSMKHKFLFVFICFLFVFVCFCLFFVCVCLFLFVCSSLSFVFELQLELCF
jgi:hypothetical protein